MIAYLLQLAIGLVVAGAACAVYHKVNTALGSEEYAYVAIANIVLILFTLSWVASGHWFGFVWWVPLMAACGFLWHRGGEALAKRRVAKRERNGATGGA